MRREKTIKVYSEGNPWFINERNVKEAVNRLYNCKFRWEWGFRNTQKRLPLMCCPNCKTFGYTAYRNEVVIEGFWKTKYTGKFTKPWFECTNCMYTKR